MVRTYFCVTNYQSFVTVNIREYTNSKEIKRIRVLFCNKIKVWSVLCSTFVTRTHKQYLHKYLCANSILLGLIICVSPCKLTSLFRLLVGVKAFPTLFCALTFFLLLFMRSKCWWACGCSYRQQWFLFCFQAKNTNFISKGFVANTKL